MIHWKKMRQLLIVVAVLLVMAPAAGAAQRQLNNSQATPAPINPGQATQAQMMLPVKISFNILPNPSYFWGAMMSEDGNFSWDGPPSMITIRVGIGGPVYNIIEGTSLPFAINTGDIKFAAGSTVLVAVQIDTKKGYRVANKLYTFPVNNSVFNITMMGPAQPLVYKPVFNP